MTRLEGNTGSASSFGQAMSFGIAESDMSLNPAHSNQAVLTLMRAALGANDRERLAGETGSGAQSAVIDARMRDIHKLSEQKDSPEAQIALGLLVVSDPEPEIKQTAGGALRALNAGLADKMQLTGTYHPAANIRMNETENLAAHNETLAAARLKEMALKDPSEYVRTRALGVLPDVDYPGAKHLAFSLLHERGLPASLRKTAEAIVQHHAEELPAGPEGSLDPSLSAQVFLMASALHEQDESARFTLTEAYMKQYSQDESALILAACLLKDENPSIRDLARHTLKDYPDVLSAVGSV